jgi:ketosteroid isomerase-like protein
MEAQILADADRVVVLWSLRGRKAANGETFEMPVASVYHMKDGRVFDSRMFHFDAVASRDFLQNAPSTAAGHQDI